MLLLQPKRLLRKIYPKAEWHYSRNEKNIYLSFDDGPIPVLTEWVLDELKNQNAKATFFCVGANILKHQTLFERIRNEGHLAGNHSMFHGKGFGMPSYDYVKDAETCRNLVENSLFRPPYGQLKRGQYRLLLKKGFRIVMWDVISYDYEKISPEQCLKIAINNTRNGSVIVFHDNLKAEQNIKYVLPRYIDHFKEKGFVFSTIPGKAQG